MNEAQPLLTENFDSFCQSYRDQVNHQLSSRLQPIDNQLKEAMAYSLLSGGKRVRPLLVYASALAVGEVSELTHAAACGIEAIHAYSLIHDDLPSMDDDDLRRGQPTNHIVFGEATAILAGDALQTAAFEWLSDSSAAETQVKMIHLLAKASGSIGMVGGQSIDLNAVDKTLSYDELVIMHRMKTGALINASVLLGYLSTGKHDQKEMECLSEFAEAIGLAFQIQDDILDVTSDTSTLGKQQGSDIANNKPTFVSLLGLEHAKDQAQSLHQQALDAIVRFGQSADYLADLARYIINRQK